MMDSTPTAVDLLRTALRISRRDLYTRPNRTPPSGSEAEPIELGATTLLAWTHDGFVDPHGPQDYSYTDLIRRYERSPSTFLHGLSGPFALVVVDPNRGTVIAARDPVGSRPIFYRIDDQHVWLAWSMVPFAEGQTGPVKADRRWLARYLAGIPNDFPDTALDGVHELGPGEVLAINKGEHTIRCWHHFSGPNRVQGPIAQPLADYREAILTAARRDRGESGTVVEIGIDAPARVLGFSVTTDLNRWNRRFRGSAVANFHRSRDEVLEVAAQFGIAEVDVITGWPGKGVMWSHWYDTAAESIGQPVYHGLLPVIAEIQEVAASTCSRFLRSQPVNLGGSFAPLLARRAIRRGRIYTAFRAQPTGLMSRLRGLAADLRPAPPRAPRTISRFLNPDVVEGFQLMERDAVTTTSPTGYSSITERGLPAAMVERMSGTSLIAATHAVDVRFPLLDSEVLRRLIALPLIANSAAGIPGGAFQRAFPEVLTRDIDWHAQSWRGLERPKRWHEGRANGRARAQYLLDCLQPALASLLDIKVLESVLQARMESSGAHDGERRPLLGVGVSEQARPATNANSATHADSVTMAHIEAVNHWLAMWPSVR